MGHDITAYRTNYSHPKAPSEYLRMNAFSNSAPLYEALKANESNGSVSGNQTDVTFDKERLVEAITNLNKIFTESIDADSTNENYSWSFFEKYPDKDDTKDKAIEYSIQYAQQLDFLARCLRLLKSDQDTVTIYFE